MESENSPALVEISPDQNQNVRRRLWCFTLFTRDGTQCIPPTELPSSMTYLHFQEEVCPTTQRHHYQGFCRIPVHVRMTQAKKKVQKAFSTSLSPRMCVTNGSVESNIRYCSKPDTRVPGTHPTILGEPPAHESNGKPTSTPLICKALLEDRLTPLEALRDPQIDDRVKSYALRYAKTWNYLLSSMIEERSLLVDPKVIVFYGVPRSGKTKLAHEMFPSSYIKGSGKWWDHYHGQTTVIYDDFDGSSMCFGDWKRVVDRYPMLVEMKGGTSKLASTVHIITTNVYPSHWWSKKVTGQDGRDAIWGRISELWYFPFKDKVASVYLDAQKFRSLPENWALEQQDPKGPERPE